MVSNGPMNDQRNASPSRMATSTSSGLAIALLHEPERLVEKGALQAIDDEPVDLAGHDDGRVTASLISAAVRSTTLASGPRRGHNLDRRDQISGLMGWATSVRARPFSVSVKAEGSKAEVELAKNRLRRGERVEPGEQFAFGVESLGRVLLHIVRAVERGFQRRGAGDPGEEVALGFVEQAMGGEFGQARDDGVKGQSRPRQDRRPTARPRGPRARRRSPRPARSNLLPRRRSS